MSSLQSHTDELFTRLESMPFEEARTKIMTRQLGHDFGSPNHEACLSWLKDKESSRRDAREEKTLSISQIVQ